MTRSLALYYRLAGTEKTLHREQKKCEAMALEFEVRQKELLTKMEEAKDNAAIARSERDEVLRQNCEIKEHNKKLGHERDGLWRELNDLTEQKGNLEKRVTELEEERSDAGRRAIEDFKASDDFQELLFPVFMQGFKNSIKQVQASFPNVDASNIEPSYEEEEEGGGGERAEDWSD